MNKLDTIQLEYEKRLLRYGIFLAIGLQLIKVLHNVYLAADQSIIMINLITISISCFVFYIHMRFPKVAAGIFYAFGLWNSLSVWNDTGGWDGMVPYNLMGLTVFIIFTSHSWLQYISLAAYGLAIALLIHGGVFHEPTMENPNYSSSSLAWDCFRIAIALVLLTEFIKTKYYRHKAAIKIVTEELKQANQTLKEQMIELDAQQHQLGLLKDNLQEIVDEKAKEEAEKSKMLTFYAFKNAHKVRAPLARVLGLLNIIELEYPKHKHQDTFNFVKKEAEQMDHIISKINKVVS